MNSKTMIIVLIILLCISLLLNIITLSKVNSIIGGKQSAFSSLFKPDTTLNESHNETKIDPSQVTDIYLGYNYSPKTNHWISKVYHLQRASDKCVFMYSNQETNVIGDRMLTCDYSKDVFDDFLKMVCSQELEEYQYKTDSNGKIIYDIEPYNIGLLYSGQLTIYNNPSNIDDIISEFEKLIEASGWQEIITTPTPSKAPIHAENEVFPNSDSERLNNSDIADMNIAELKEALNEIYARHGENDKEQSTNSSTDKDYNKILNRIEKYNVELLKNAIREIQEKAA